MVAVSVVFLTPTAIVVVVAALLPLAALVVAGRRSDQARRLLGLSAPPALRRLPTALAVLAIPALLGIAAAQPALRSRGTLRVRTDAQALYVLDISRSMLASSSPSASTRLERAKRDAIAIRAALPQIPSGVATLTDRVLPNLLPVDSAVTFDQTVTGAVAIDQPPPEDDAVVATSLSALGSLASANVYDARVRLLVVLTDGESKPFDANRTGRALKAARIRLVVVHVSEPGEHVYDGSELEQGYHEDTSSGRTLASLADAAGGTAVGEHAIAGAVHAARVDAGAGPTRATTRTEHTRSIAPFVALLALVPLALLAVTRARRTGTRRAPEASRAPRLRRSRANRA